MRMLLLALPITLAACDVQTDVSTGKDERVAVKADAEGRLAFNLPFAKGEVKLPAELMQNSNFSIDGVGLMPGATITGFNMDAAGQGQPTVNLTFQAPTSPAEVQAWFLQQFEAKGIQAQAAAQAITGLSKDGASFTMRFAPQADGTLGTIELKPKA